jgi:hypothetical protein
MIDMLVDIVSRNGNLLLDFPLPSSGMLDPQELAILEEITKWMGVNSGRPSCGRVRSERAEPSSKPAGLYELLSPYRLDHRLYHPAASGGSPFQPYGKGPSRSLKCWDPHLHKGSEQRGDQTGP